MAVFSSATANKNTPRWVWRLTLLASTLALAVGALLWRSLETFLIADIQAAVYELKPVLTGIRWGLIGLVAIFWPDLTNRLCCLGHLDAAGKVQLLALRGRVLVWLVLLELVLGQNLPRHFLRAMRGGGA